MFIHKILSLFLAYLIYGAASDERSSRRIQIGVKKRIENCKIRSKKGDLLHVHYKGTLDNDVVFDTSHNRDEPLTFTLGSEQVIKGWEQGLMGMCVGEKRKLVIPPDFAYGQAGVPPKVPPNSTVIYLVEMMDIERKPEL